VLMLKEVGYDVEFINWCGVVVFGGILDEIR